MLLLVLGGLEAGRLDLPEGRPLLPLLLLLILLLLQNILAIKTKIKNIKYKLALPPFLLFFLPVFRSKWKGWVVCYNELSQKKPGLNLYQSRHCAYITYSVKTWFLKNLSVALDSLNHVNAPLVLVRVLVTKFYFMGWDFFLMFVQLAPWRRFLQCTLFQWTLSIQQ